jgi:hypothetical protein
MSFLLHLLSHHTALPLEKESPVPIEWVTGWVIETIWTYFWEYKNFLFVSEVEPQVLCCAVRTLFAVPTTLSQLTPFSAAEWYVSSLQALKSIQANDYGGRGPVVKVATSMSYRDQDCARILLGKQQTKSFVVILLRNPSVSRHAEHTVGMQPVLLFKT